LLSDIGEVFFAALLGGAKGPCSTADGLPTRLSPEGFGSEPRTRGAHFDGVPQVAPKTRKWRGKGLKR